MTRPAESPDAYRQLFELSPQPTWVYDRETLRFLLVNEAAVTAYGYSRAEFATMRITDIRPPEDVPALLADVAATASLPTNRGIWRHRRRDGTVRLVDVCSRAVEFEGRPARLVSVTDVTEREEALDTLRGINDKYERQYAALVELTRGGLGAVRESAAMLRAMTESTARTLGVSRVSVWKLTSDRDAIVAADLYELEHDRHSSGAVLEAQSYPSYFQALAGTNVIAADDARSDARTREFTTDYLVPNGITSMLDTPLVAGGVLDGVVCLEHVGAPRVWTAGERSFAMSVANLISMFMAQLSHAQSEERFQLVARATNDAVWDLDLATGRLWWGDGFETLFGFSDEQDDNLTAWENRVHPEDRQRVTDSLNAAIANVGNTWSEQYRFRRRDGTYAHVIDRGHVILDSAGVATRMIGGMTDVTAQKQLEAELLHSRRLESIGRLAGGIAHDFNNLLTVVLGTVDQIITSGAANGEMLDDLYEVYRAADRAAGLTRQLLAFSRRQVLKPRVVNLNDIVLDTATMLRRLIGGNIELVLRPAPDLGNVTADPAQLEQVLVNLAVNARDAMPDGGILRIETANGEADDGSMVTLVISDTGVGMDAIARENAFEPFFTTKAPGLGTGLGLATVYGVVQQSGGTIELESAPGTGARFTIRLPRTDLPAEAAGGDGAAAPVQGTETILVVEDEAPLRRLVERVLRSAGFAVVSAGTGEEALELLQRHEGELHLLLTDVVMPRMSGTELASIVLARSPRTAALFMSGYTSDAGVLREIRDGRARFLEKPFTTAQLTAAVRRALDGRRP